MYRLMMHYDAYQQRTFDIVPEHHLHEAARRPLEDLGLVARRHRRVQHQREEYPPRRISHEILARAIVTVPSQASSLRNKRPDL